MARLLYIVNIARFFVSHRLPLAIAAKQAGYDVHVTAINDGDEYVQAIQQAGLHYTPWPMAQHGTNPLSEWQALRWLNGYVRHLKPDLVHNVAIKALVYGGLVARWNRVPVVVSAMSGLGYVFEDNPKSNLLRAGLAPILRLALVGDNLRLIFQNPDDQARFIQTGLIPRARSLVIAGSGVDVNHFHPQPEPDGLPVVLYAGRLMVSKGLRLFVDAARQLRGQARFVVVGYAEATHPDMIPPEQLQTWADEGVIEWWGKRDDMPQVMAQSHIVCLPSLYREGLSKVLIEAAASGRATVTTDVPGCRDAVTHGQTGLVIPPNDLEALVTAIHTLLVQPQVRQRMGQAGRQKAVQEFALERVIQATLDLYEQQLTHAGLG